MEVPDVLDIGHGVSPLAVLPSLLRASARAAAGVASMSLANLSAAGHRRVDPHLSPERHGGEVRIVNTNGEIDVEGVDGSTVEVQA